MQTDVKTYDEMQRMSCQSTGGYAHEQKRSRGNSMWWHGRRGNNTIRTLLIVTYMVFPLPTLSARILPPPFCRRGACAFRRLFGSIRDCQ